jgi:hypothetical protein
MAQTKDKTQAEVQKGDTDSAEAKAAAAVAAAVANAETESDADANEETATVEKESKASEQAAVGGAGESAPSAATVQLVVIKRFRDKYDGKTLYEVGDELEFDSERAEDVISRYLAVEKSNA